jgi:hypothetical protein
MTAKCHVCGVGRPEHLGAAHPVCHPCRCAFDRYQDRTHAELAIVEREARMRLHDAVVNLRRVKAARSGMASLGTYLPLPEHRGAAKISTP